MSSCSKDAFNENAQEDFTKQQFKENFVKKYPHVDLNSQTWDFSCPITNFGLASSSAKTRGSETISAKQNKVGTYEVDPATLTWLKTNLKEKQDNSSKGSPFYLTSTGSPFSIIPIYQGQAVSVWDLHMVVDGVDSLVSTKIR